MTLRTALADWCRTPQRQPEDVVRLGRLLHRWEELTGQPLVEHVAPSRIRGETLEVCCSSSQWMHFMLFARVALIERLQREMPELRISRIDLKLEKFTPVPRPPGRPRWPDWREILSEGAALDLPEGPYRELILRARAKTLARLDGLAAEGLIPCPQCQSSLVQAAGGICAVCLHRKQIERRASLRQALTSQPWATDTELQTLVPDGSAPERQGVREEMLDECRERIEDLVRGHDESPSGEMAADLHLELGRYLMLVGQVPPDRLDLANPRQLEQLPGQWQRLIAIDLKQATSHSPGGEGVDRR
jgi:hypothetical protein